MNKAIALYYQGRRSEAGALVTLALEVALAADLPEAALRAYYNRAEFRCAMASIAEGVRDIESGLALARERGSRAWERDLLSQSVQIDVLRGEWEGALVAAQSLDVPGAEESHRLAVANLPVIFAARGELAALEAAIAAAPPPSEWSELRTLETLAQAVARSAKGQPAQAADLVTSVADELAHLSTVPVAVFLLDAVDILLVAGRRDVASRLTGGDLPEPPLMAPLRLQAKAILHADAGAHIAAEEAFRVALSEQRKIESPFTLARCLHHLGALLRAGSDPDEGFELLREADELFERLGAAAWLERNRAQVAA